MPLHYLKCTEDQLDKLVWICEKTFRDAFESQNTPEDFERYMQLAFNRESIAKELRNPDSAFYLAYEGPVLVGYFKLNEDMAQTDLREQNSLEIERIYVLSAHQGRKIGYLMLEQIKSLALERKKASIWLGVWEQNTAAIAFYEKHGFFKFGVHPYCIGSDEQTDWLMRYILPTLTSQNTTG